MNSVRHFAYFVLLLPCRLLTLRLQPIQPELVCG